MILYDSESAEESYDILYSDSNKSDRRMRETCVTWPGLSIIEKSAKDCMFDTVEITTINSKVDRYQI